MNKHFYRIIFNKVRGMLMIVAEIAKGHQSTASRAQKAKRTINDKKIVVSLKPLVFLSYVALGMVTLTTTSYANTIIVDQNADKSQRPTTHQVGNGVTQINIQQASKGGVSHNKYTQFDVSEKGVILNNSSQISNTQLAGYIKGNDNLIRSGSAKVILNEVNAKDASKIAGYIEVAGQKAQVIIGGSLSGAINAGMQYTLNEDGSVNWKDVGISTIVGTITGGVGTGFWGTVGWNAAGGATSSYIDGKDPLVGAALGTISSGVGYFGGKWLQGSLQKAMNPVSKQYEWIPIGTWTITKPAVQSSIPAISGSVLDSGLGEITEKVIENRLEKIQNENK